MTGWGSIKKVFGKKSTLLLRTSITPPFISKKWSSFFSLVTQFWSFPFAGGRSEEHGCSALQMIRRIPGTGPVVHLSPLKRFYRGLLISTFTCFNIRVTLSINPDCFIYLLSDTIFFPSQCLFNSAYHTEQPIRDIHPTSPSDDHVKPLMVSSMLTKHREYR